MGKALAEVAQKLAASEREREREPARGAAGGRATSGRGLRLEAAADSACKRLPPGKASEKSERERAATSLAAASCDSASV